MTKQEELITILIQNDIIPRDQAPQIAAALKEPGSKIDDVLLKKRLIDAEKLAQIKAKVYGMPYINLRSQEVKPEVLKLISGDVAENYKVVCFDRNADQLMVGLTDPDNFKAIEAIDFLAKRLGTGVEYYLITEKSYLSAVKMYKDANQELNTALEQRASEEEELLSGKEQDEIEIEEVTKSAPVAKIVSVIIRNAVEGGASDIHVEPLFKESRVRYRIDGILHTSLVLPRNVHAAIVARIKVMANLKLDETRMPQDGRIRAEIGEKVIDFRVSTLPLIGAEKVVMRILDTTRGAPKLEELGFQGQQLQAIMTALEKTEGIILITGPTGSGKSTTIFSILDIVNKEGINIATLEDPVEYQMQGVNQSQVKPEIGYTFASGLRSFLRQDPDIIMVGEIRDEETAELSVHAALTGHMVFSTLHTTDAPGAITRLVDMKVQAFLLGSTLIAVVAQRLTRKICGKCKEETKLPDNFVKEVQKDLQKIDNEYIKTLLPDFDEKNLKFYKGKGCSACGNTGYSGRAAVSEVMVITDELKEKILDGRKYLSVSDIKAVENFLTVKQDGILKVIQGITTYDEVLRVMRD